MLSLSFKEWSSGAHNGSRWGIVFRRWYWRGKWTPIVYWWPHRVGRKTSSVGP